MVLKLDFTHTQKKPKSHLEERKFVIVMPMLAGVVRAQIIGFPLLTR